MLAPVAFDGWNRYAAPRILAKPEQITTERLTFRFFPPFCRQSADCPAPPMVESLEGQNSYQTKQDFTAEHAEVAGKNGKCQISALSACSAVSVRLVSLRPSLTRQSPELSEWRFQSRRVVFERRGITGSTLPSDKWIMERLYNTPLYSIADNSHKIVTKSSQEALFCPVLPHFGQNRRASAAGQSKTAHERPVRVNEARPAAKTPRQRQGANRPPRLARAGR
jgi:hypothetical protein